MTNIVENIFDRKMPLEALPYKVECKGPFDRYGTRICTLGISVGQEYHEGEKFYSLLQWSEQKFDKVQILVGDSLQRHNISFLENLNEEDSYKKSLKNGDEWIMRNCQNLKNIEITRWDSLAKNPLVTPYLEKTLSTFENNPVYKHEIETIIRDVYMRLNNRSPDLYSFDRFKDFYMCSKDYLLEESAVFSFLQEDNQGGMLYPGSMSIKNIIDLNGNIKEREGFILVNLHRRKNKIDVAA